jgi:TRAP-type C4-dicarboxylate transport system substrate-binding protein
MIRAAFVCAVVAAGIAPARAETVLRMATVAPDGTAWAHELRAFGQNVELRTNGRVRVKWYFGSVAGGDLDVGERIHRGQLDGAGSGGPLCAAAMPSLRVMQVPALFESAAEARFVVNQLSAKLTAEAQAAGLTFLAATPLGVARLFASRPVRSLAELRNMHIWIWDAERILVALYHEMGLTMVPSPVDRAAREFEAGHVDSFWSLPTAALAFQWSVRAPYLVDLRGEYLFGCVLVANRAFLGLSADDQLQLRGAAAELRERLDEVSQREERALLGGLFQHQGVRVIAVGERFRAEFRAAATSARARIGGELVAPALLDEVSAALARYRAQRAVAR